MKSSKLNLFYENILRSLPEQTDLRYLTVSVLNNRGCYLEIPHTGISLTIPEDAVLLDEDHLIFLALLYTETQMPTLNSHQTCLSPVILIGPSDITLVKPAVLTFEHSSVLDTPWKYHLMFSEDIRHWKSILTHGQENISTPVCLQFDEQQKAFLLVRISSLPIHSFNCNFQFETMGAYALIGESLFNHHAAKYVQMACFYNQSSIRIRFWNKTSDAYERCLNEEIQLQNCLAEQPRDFLCYDYPDQICLNVDLELSIQSRMNLGYKEIPLKAFWTNEIYRSCFIFLIPNNTDELTKNFLHQFALHINVYQGKILENALHTRLRLDTHQVRVQFLSNEFCHSMRF